MHSDTLLCRYAWILRTYDAGSELAAGGVDVGAAVAPEFVALMRAPRDDRKRTNAFGRVPRVGHPGVALSGSGHVRAATVARTPRARRVGATIVDTFDQRPLERQPSFFAVRYARQAAASFTNGYAD